MASTTAILEVSRAIRSLIAANVPLVTDSQVVIESIDLLSDPVPIPRVTVFLYNIQENPELKNRPHGVAATGPGSSTLAPPPMVIDLDYLICAWTSTTDDEHRLLGHVLRTLYDFPELSSTTLGTGWGADELVQLSLANPPIEDQTRIWTNFGFKRFKLSLYYRARVVPIQSSRLFEDGVVGERRADIRSTPPAGPDLDSGLGV